MLRDVVGHLRCPHCGAALALADRTVRCATGHAFDVARQGYASLLPGDAQTATGDSAAMVAARAAFLGAGHFAPIVAAVAEAARSAVPPRPGLVVDLGAGTGHHLARVLDELPDRSGLALDLSAYALRRAARAHPRIGAARCDTWRPLPVRDGVAAAVLCVFAPRNAAEIERILTPGGALVVVTPNARHLAELVDVLGLLHVDDRKAERLREQLEPRFQPVEHVVREDRLALDRRSVAAAVAMGPSARHVDPATLAARVERLPEPQDVTASVTVSVYRREPPSTG